MSKSSWLCPVLIVLMACSLLLTLQAEDDVPAPADPFAKAYQAALIAYKNGDFSEARAAADDAKKLKPDDPKIALLRGRIATEQKDYRVAEKEIALALQADPGNTLALRAKGDLSFHQRLFSQAKTEYETYSRATAGSADSLVMLAYCAIGNGDMAKAGEYARELIPFSEKNPGYNFVQAAIAKASGNEAEAERQLQVARVNHGVILVTDQMRDYLLLFSTKN